MIINDSLISENCQYYNVKFVLMEKPRYVVIDNGVIYFTLFIIF